MLAVPLSYVVYIGFDFYRYHSATTYYDIGDTVLTSGNTWKWADRILTFGGMSIGEILTVTQILSMFGIATDINVFLWMLSTMLFIPLISVSYYGLMFWSYDRAYVSIENGLNASDAATLQSTVLMELAKMSVLLSAYALIFYMYTQEWMMAQWIALPTEVQDKWRSRYKWIVDNRVDNKPEYFEVTDWGSATLWDIDIEDLPASVIRHQLNTEDRALR